MQFRPFSSSRLAAQRQSLTSAQRSKAHSRLRENMLLVSGLGFLIIAAGMIVGASMHQSVL